MKNPYTVMFIKDDKIIWESDWIMAKDEVTATRLAVAEEHTIYDEEVCVLCKPFC